MAEYAVRGSKIYCDKCAGRTTYLEVPLSHGVEKGGQPAAAAKDCVPFVNVHPFGECMSPGYEAAKQAFLARHPEKAYLFVGKGGHPCFVDLLPRWFDNDDSSKIASFEETGAMMAATGKVVLGPEYSSVTTNSWNVCRAGGNIRFASGGQQPVAVIAAQYRGASNRIPEIEDQINELLKGFVKASMAGKEDIMVKVDELQKERFSEWRSLTTFERLRYPESYKVSYPDGFWQDRTAVARHLLKNMPEAKDLDHNMLLAIMKKETKVLPIWENRLVIRFEVHRFFVLSGDKGKDTFFKVSDGKHWFSKNGTVNKDGVNLHVTGMAPDLNVNYEAFEAGKKLDKMAAYGCLGMGAPQLQGENAKIHGYKDAIEQYSAFSKGFISQIKAMILRVTATVGVPKTNIALAVSNSSGMGLMARCTAVRESYNSRADPVDYDKPLAAGYLDILEADKQTGFKEAQAAQKDWDTYHREGKV